MLSITKDDLKNALEHDRAAAVSVKRRIGGASFIILLLSIAEFIFAERIAGTSMLWLVLWLAFAMINMSLFRLVPYFILFADNVKKLGIGNAIRLTSHIRKYSGLYAALRSHICSDDLKKYTDSLIAAEKHPYDVFQLGAIKFYICIRRCEDDAALASAESMQDLFRSGFHNEADLLSVQLNKAMLYGSDDEYLRLIRDKSELLEKSKSEGLENALAYLKFAAYEKQLSGDINGAAELLEMSREYCLDRFNSPQLPVSANSQLNLSRYQAAQYLMDTAALLLKMGNESRCRQLLEESESMMKLVNCEMPERYAREHKMLVTELRNRGQ